MKYALCQELFEDRSWEDQCRTMASLGYTGIEVAPFALANHPSEISAERRRELKQIAEDHGLQIIGLHWLLARTTGFHLTTDDAAVRTATADYLSLLSELCADLGGTIMVFGSPFQRSLREGLSREEGFDRAVEVFSRCAPSLGARNVTLCVEPLTTKETNFINTCAEAATIIERVGHPAIALHQDVKAMLGEGTPLPELIEQFKSITKHFHVNDENLLGPGMGNVQYEPILKALRDTGYDGWVSVEVFDYAPGADHIAKVSIDYMKRVNAALDQST